MQRLTKFSQRIVRDSGVLKRSLATQPNRNPEAETKLFINNEFVNAKSGKMFDTLNPTNGSVITKVAEADSVCQKLLF